MKNPVLMNIEEPTDKELTQLMHEVATEAKSKALKSQQKLAELIKQQIIAASAKK